MKKAAKEREQGKPALPLDLDSIFSALADPTRREIVRSLANGPKNVSDLARPFSMSLPAISRHLSVLQKSGLVHQDKQGRERHCRLNPQPLQEVSDWANECRDFWNNQFQAMDKFLATLDENGEPLPTSDKKGK